MFPVAIMAGAGWLFLFAVLLVVPPSSRPHEGGGQGAGREQGRTRRPPGAGDVCVVSATPGGPLAPFERRAVAHVAVRAGARGEVPAPALSEGFGGGETEFMSAFRAEVDAEARRLGLTRSRLSGRRIALLLLLLLIPAGAVLAWPDGGRTVAYAAALGAAPAALAVFAQGNGKVAWSSYRGSWQLLEIETNTWSWPQGCAIWLAIVFGPILYFSAAIWLSTHGMVLLAEEMIGLVVAGGIAAVLVALVRRAAFPRFAEFDGQVIRQWMVKGDSESPDQYHVAIDDGTRDQAWDLSIGSEPYRRLTPGTFVRARVNLRHRDDVTVAAVEPAPRAWSKIDFNQY